VGFRSLGLAPEVSSLHWQLELRSSPFRTIYPPKPSFRLLDGSLGGEIATHLFFHFLTTILKFQSE
jgi:hypothetical protein